MTTSHDMTATRVLKLFGSATGVVSWSNTEKLRLATDNIAGYYNTS